MNDTMNILADGDALADAGKLDKAEQWPSKGDTYKRCQRCAPSIT